MMAVQDWEHVYTWQIHVDVWQNQYNIIKYKKKSLTKKQKQQQQKRTNDKNNQEQL